MAKFPRVGIAVAGLVAGMAFAWPAVADDGVEPEVQQQVNEYNTEQQRENRKLICRKEARIGTRFKETVCRTVATMEVERNGARRMLDDMPKINKTGQ